MAVATSTDPQNATPALYHHHQQSDIIDSDKFGMVLLSSGVLLGLIGVGFTILGWYRYTVTTSYEWTQLLGPIFISVGGTFMLTSVCRFWGCRSCRYRYVDVFGISRMQQTPTRQACTINGISQPIVLGSPTDVICIPPYTFATWEINHPSGLHLGGSMSDRSADLPPQYDAVCNAAIAEDEEEEGRGTDRRSRKTERRENGGRDQGESSTVNPPAYEDIYPSSNKHNGP